MNISKARAFAIHISISVAIFLLLLWILVFRWFPSELFFMGGGWQGVRIIAAVDLVLGPVLTLLFYRPGKPRLLLDMSMIVLLQVAALGYGVWTAYQQSIVALTFVEGRFVTLTQKALTEGDRQMREAGKPTQSLEAFGDLHPPQIYVQTPSAKEFGKYLASVLNGQPELHERSHRFRPLRGNIEKIASYQVTPDELGEEEAGLQQKLNNYLAENHVQAASARQFFRIKSRYGSGIAVVDANEGEIIDIISAQ